MKLELKKLKIVDSLSEETTCFSAEVWCGGKKVGTASNRGHGGMTDVWFDDKTFRKQFDDESEEAADDIVDNLVEAEAKKKHFKKLHNQMARWLKIEVLFKCQGDAFGSWRTMRHLGQVGRAITTIKQKYGAKIERIISTEADVEKYISELNSKNSA